MYLRFRVFSENAVFSRFRRLSSLLSFDVVKTMKRIENCFFLVQRALNITTAWDNRSNQIQELLGDGGQRCSTDAILDFIRNEFIILKAAHNVSVDELMNKPSERC